MKKSKQNWEYSENIKKLIKIWSCLAEVAVKLSGGYPLCQIQSSNPNRHEVGFETFIQLWNLISEVLASNDQICAILKFNVEGKSWDVDDKWWHINVRMTLIINKLDHHDTVTLKNVIMTFCWINLIFIIYILINLKYLETDQDGGDAWYICT